MQKQRKASNTTTSEIVLESLREQIINGTLQPGENWQKLKLPGNSDSAEVLCAKHSDSSPSKV